MMNFSMSLWPQTSRMLDIPPGVIKMDMLCPRSWQKEKVVIVMGPTGTGKSRLSIDLATQFPAEIINSDKMQVYKGLDIVTNKVGEEEKSGLPHHLLGIANPNVDFTAANYCQMASSAVESISSRGLLPIIAGGSNSYIEALMDDEDFRLRLRYDCCFLWIDVSMPVLHKFVSRRVEQMVSMGMINEVRNLFDPRADYSTGIRRSIGVPEFDRYFRAEDFLDEENRARLLHEAICDVKRNTCKLACRQWEKINRLRKIKGWNIHRVDATEVFRSSGKEAEHAWEMLVARPSTAIVGQFLGGVSAADKVPALATMGYIRQCLVA
ncbi:ADENYLATE ISOPENTENYLTRANSFERASE 5 CHLOROPLASTIC [Salix viminalis]|nr:ADENYLATE ISOPENTENYLTRANSFERASE 5 CHLOROPLASTIC [Salix viminalis]